jgi:hypothetical protein
MLIITQIMAVGARNIVPLQLLQILPWYPGSE